MHKLRIMRIDMGYRKYVFNYNLRHKPVSTRLRSVKVKYQLLYNKLR